MPNAAQSAAVQQRSAAQLLPVKPSAAVPTLASFAAQAQSLAEPARPRTKCSTRSVSTLAPQALPLPPADTALYLDLSVCEVACTRAVVGDASVKPKAASAVMFDRAQATALEAAVHACRERIAVGVGSDSMLHFEVAVRTAEVERR